MTGVAERARTSVDTYRTEAATAGSTLADCARRIDEALSQLSGGGLLGTSEDPNLIATRGQLAQAREMFKDAATATEASRDPLSRFVQRVFPS